MKISVIGTLVKDCLYPYNGGMYEGIGGIHFTISHLAAILQDTDKIIPITYLGDDLYKEYSIFIKSIKNVSDEGLFKYLGKNNSVILKYNSINERMEISKFPLPPIPIEKIKLFLNCDFLIINMISGWDIELATLEKIREIYPGRIYLDLHSLVLGRKKTGERDYRKPADFQKWFDLVDYIQLNEKEFEILNDQNASLEEFFINYCFSKDKLINLTLGKNGSKSVYWDKGKINTIIKEPKLTGTEKDPTGCGDAFMAGFIYGIVTNKQIEQSLELANFVGSVNCEYYGVPDINYLKVRLRQKQII